MATAVQKLERSQLSPKTVQRELMGDNLDTESILVYFQSKVKFQSIDRVIDVDIERTIEGASTIVLRLNDHDRAVLRSGLLSNKLDVKIDGLWFRLVKVNKQGDQLNLTFEDREIAVLRLYNKLKVARRTNVTRAEFVVNLLQEVKEFRIPHVIPELHRVQTVMAATTGQQIDWEALLNKTKGVAKDVNATPDIVPTATTDQVQARGVTSQRTLTIKGQPADTNQIKNANIIVQVGETMGARRKVVVSAIMTAITESTLRNLPYGDKDSLGLFQQRDSWGSREDRLDPATAARLYYQHAIKNDTQDPTMGYGELCQSVQISAFPDRYDRYRTEAERLVTAGGLPGGDGVVSAASVNNSKPGDAGGGSDYLFYRGTPDSTKKTWKKENSWDCIQRLAEDVQWRAFFVSGVFYFIAEDDLIKSLPIATITESSAGVEGIDGDYDEGKKTATLTITCRVGAWLVPPGAVVVLQGMGPWNGRWLVSRFNRSLLSTDAATITLSKPLPRLPEPLLNDINTPQQPGWADTPATGDPGVDSTPVNTDVTTGAAESASKLLGNKGWHDDNGRGKSQLFKASLGQKLAGAEGLVPLDPRVPGVVLWLIQQGYTIGTFAWCEDHHDDGPDGHAGGRAVDISSINGHAVSEDSATVGRLVLAVVKLIHEFNGPLAPRQLICGGYGNHRDIQISQYSIPSADAFYGAATMAQHCNHIHVGY